MEKENKPKCKILGALATTEQDGWPGEVYLLCEAKKLYVYVKIFTRTIILTHLYT